VCVPRRPIQPNTLQGGTARPNIVARSLDRAAHLAARGQGLPFGRNSDAVLDLLGRVGSLGPEQAERLISFWSAIPAAERADAHSAAQATAQRSGRRSAARAAQTEALRWLNEESGSSDLWGSDGASGHTRDWAEIRREAFPAVLDAVAATVLADLLEPGALEALLGPWDATVGETVESGTAVPEGTGSGMEIAEPGDA
jgi:hypothetical protein